MKKKTLRYIITILVCVLIVATFAVIQYQFIQKVEFNFTNYIVPVIVGILFGFLISRITILEQNYHHEKDQVLDKNKKIHMYVGTIVHDLKSPISAVYSIMELLLKNKDFRHDKTAGLIEISKTSLESVLENIQLLLDNTKLESGKMMAHLEQGNPYYTINSAIDKHLVLAINKSITIQRLIDRNIPDIEYDKEMLDRILSNLISNSIKYSPAKTQINIFSELFDDTLNLVVEDEGQGLSDDDLQNLFIEFKTLSAKPTGGEVSTGLGLSVTKRLVEELGGTIWAESEGKGKGAKFKIALPILAEKEDLKAD